MDQIIEEYSAEPFVVKEPLVLISIGTMYYQRSVYDAVRCAWKINVNRARQCDLVLAHLRGLVVGAFRPTKWLPATIENFPGLEHIPDRWGFVGDPAEDAVWQQYVRKRVPEEYRKKGAANPVRFCEPGQA